MKGEAGASGSRAVAWEDGVYFWILWGVGTTGKVRPKQRPGRLRPTRQPQGGALYEGKTKRARTPTEGEAHWQLGVG